MAPSSTLRVVPNSADFARGLEGFRLRVPTGLESTGIAELDAILGGGVPRGSIVELCGSGSSGRTSLSFSLLAAATERQETCAYVDVCDSLDPLSLASAGVDLKRILWVRCGVEEVSNSARVNSSGKSPSIQAQGKSQPHLENTAEKKRRTQAWRHPRDQIRGIEGSIPAILGRGGNAKAFSHAVRLACEEAAEAPVLASCAEGQTRRLHGPRGEDSQEWEAPGSGKRNSRQQWRGAGAGANKKLWKILEQALRTTDLLLHGGGWGVVVFDLGNISWVDARRIELSTWFRFRRAIEHTPTILLLLGEEACAKSCSSLVLQCERKGEEWSGTNVESRSAGIATLEGFEMEGRIASSRTGLRLMDSARWMTRTLWSEFYV